ncbi:hypothetical protein EN45_029650 [Penicillium chrysogenum]|uniref:F-box domain-containing protein n=1 Tax=Penicillium chrysogenum TaxID=5076 RepID=A0A167XGL5_PENCH|nr:hypothetical protein EN45_029650 [Penicillium chrysogenum]
MLLQLPTELIQLVLRHCETSAYFQAAFSSRRLYEIASSSRAVIVHQLHNTPGWNDGIEAHQTRHLFGELMKRSYEQLDGAEHYAIPTYKYQNRVIDYHASTMETSEDSIRALLVFKGHSTVHLVDMSHGGQTEVQLKSPGQDIGEVEIIQTAFDEHGGVYVLHRFKPFLDQELDTDHPFVKHALESHPNGNAAFEAYVLTSTNDQDPSALFSRRIGPVMRLTFNDRGLQLLYHYRAQNIYGAFQRLEGIPGPPGEPKPHVNKNACTVQFSPSLSLQFSIGIPFFGTHELGDRTQGEQCHWQYLAFGIATHRVEKWTVACLLKSESYTGPRCTHVLNLDRGRRFDDWQIMAQLGGFREIPTSHGSPVATSRRGTRVAVVNWKTLYVWALNPSELIQDNHTGFYPSSWETSTGVIELRPVVLQLEAVCSQLRFTEKEDELVAITDRGVMFLDIGYSGKSKQPVKGQGCNHSI